MINDLQKSMPYYSYVVLPNRVLRHLYLSGSETV